MCSSVSELLSGYFFTLVVSVYCMDFVQELFSCIITVIVAVTIDICFAFSLCLLVTP
jgi:hypothetical protein